MEPHLTDRQSGIARSSVARLFYSTYQYLVTRSVLPISIDLVSKVAVASGEEVTATFRRVSFYRGGSCLRATAKAKIWSLYGAFLGRLLRHEEYLWQLLDFETKVWTVIFIEGRCSKNLCRFFYFDVLKILRLQFVWLSFSLIPCDSGR